MNGDVRGWCLGRDGQGAPTLSECAVVRGAEGRYFTQLVDSQNNAITVRTYQRGETFFTNHVDALEGLRERLATELTRHQMKMVYLDRRLEMTMMEIAVERKARDAGR